jgi:hypothetical protein
MRDWHAFRAQAGDPVATEEGILRLDLLPYATVRIDTK